MRSLLFVSLVNLVGCSTFLAHESRGKTRKEHAGNMTLVFTNATSQPMCGLHIAFDHSDVFGDNWLPREGLPSGKSIELQVKPGKYKATWNTCKQGTQPYFAGTLTAETSFNVSEATQLFAFVADKVAPTKRALPRDFHKLVKFAGQEIAPLGAQPASTIAEAPNEKPAATPETAAPAPAKVDMSAFIDHQAARKNMASKTAVKPKASLKRVHDVVNAKAGYVQR
jgi:hypothetical protein